MKAHLASLLWRVYDGALAPEHLADLRKSGLTDETIADQLFRSVPPATIPRLVGFECPRARSMMLIPFRSPAGGFMDHVRVKIFPPLTDAAGHSVKYLQPRGAGPRVYFVARCLADVLEGDAPLWIVEGEKKALAVAQLGLPAVGICGVEGWHQRGDERLLPDFDALRLRGRIVDVLPDGDYHTNPNVRRAVQRLGYALDARGAQPRVRLLPSELPQ
ncbi:MAG: DUF3854 domain-containing protein [Candidatus Rokuibacteriota bacterium]